MMYVLLDTLGMVAATPTEDVDPVTIVDRLVYVPLTPVKSNNLSPTAYPSCCDTLVLNKPLDSLSLQKGAADEPALINDWPYRPTADMLGPSANCPFGPMYNLKLPAPSLMITLLLTPAI